MRRLLIGMIVLLATTTCGSDRAAPDATETCTWDRSTWDRCTLAP